MDRRIDDAAHIVEIDNMAASYLDRTEKIFEKHFVDVNKMMTDYDSARRLVNGKWDWELISGFGKELHAALIDAWSWGTESVVKNLSRRVANQVQYVFDLKFAEAEKALRLQAFTIAGISNGQVLENVKDILIDCLDEGLTFQQFQDRANLSMAESGFVKPRWHLELIYRNNLMTAFHTGRYAQLMDEDVRMEFPLWEYNAILDGAVRPSHAAMDGKRFLSNDPIWDKWYPPNGHNCRCGVSAVSKYEMEEENIQPTGPPPVSVEPDFGWERNAGKDLVWLEKWQEGKMRGMGGAKVPDGKAEAEAKAKTKAEFKPANTVAEAEERVGSKFDFDKVLNDEQKITIANRLVDEVVRIKSYHSKLKDIKINEIKISRVSLKDQKLGGYYDAETKTIFINLKTALAEKIIDPKEWEKISKKIGSTVVDLEDVLRHEIGHAIQFQLLSENQTFNYRDDSFNYDDSAIKSDISKYAITDPDEAFSEMFNLIISGKKNKFKTYKSIQKIINGLLK